MSKNKTIKHTPIYSLNDYNSGDGMLTSVWGPGMWHVLPCGKCRKNLRDNFKKLPLKMKHMESRYTFSRYIYDLHELINSMLGKTSGLTYEMIRERYEHFRARCSISLKEITSKLKKVHTKKNKEKGCTEPLYGEKSKCVLKIIPHTSTESTFQVDEKCVKKILE